MNNNSHKLYYIDMVKAIGIILLIIGHQTSGTLLQSAIYSFHMPLFVIVSGFLIQYNTGYAKSFKDLLVRKARSLLVPYITFGFFLIFYGILCKVLNYSCWYFLSYKQIISLTFNQIIGYGIGTLWFLPFLFCIEIIVWILMKLEKRVAILILFFLVAIAYCSGGLAQNLVYSNIKVYVAVGEILTVICRVAIGLPFAIFGIFLCRMFALLNEKRIVVFSVFSFFIWSISVLIMNSPMVDLFSLNIPNVLLYYMNAITGSFWIITLCKNCFDKKTHFAELFGGGSLLFMVFNNLPSNSAIYDGFTIIIGKQIPCLEIFSILISETILVLIFRNSKCLKKIFFLR